MTIYHRAPTESSKYFPAARGGVMGTDGWTIDGAPGSVAPDTVGATAIMDADGQLMPVPADVYGHLAPPIGVLEDADPDWQASPTTGGLTARMSARVDGGVVRGYPISTLDRAYTSTDAPGEPVLPTSMLQDASGNFVPFWPRQWIIFDPEWGSEMIRSKTVYGEGAGATMAEAWDAAIIDMDGKPPVWDFVNPSSSGGAVDYSPWYASVSRTTEFEILKLPQIPHVGFRVVLRGLPGIQRNTPTNQATATFDGETVTAALTPQEFYNANATAVYSTEYDHPLKVGMTGTMDGPSSAYDLGAWDDYAGFDLVFFLRMY